MSIQNEQLQILPMIIRTKVSFTDYIRYQVGMVITEYKAEILQINEEQLKYSGAYVAQQSYVN